ncbi:MAG: hypothetical protein HY304_03225 [candidate division Zixibacteria bacterium]|nr:hypothetical protein [candidate division Zixibacteria bacterium]
MTEANGKNGARACSLPELQDQLGHAVTMAAKQDQIVWTVYGVFCAANAVLLVALFTTGKVPPPPVGMVVSAAGAALSWAWWIIQWRALCWLGYYETIIEQVEILLNLPAELCLSSGINKVTRRDRIRGMRVRGLKVGSALVAAFLWTAALAGFAFRCQCSG